VSARVVEGRDSMTSLPMVVANPPVFLAKGRYLREGDFVIDHWKILCLIVNYHGKLGRWYPKSVCSSAFFMFQNATVYSFQNDAVLLSDYLIRHGGRR
jgi:hypothetical protein